MNESETHAVVNKVDLLRRGCRNITQAGPLPFLEQNPVCVFSLGGCHIFAAALHNRLIHQLPDLRVFHLYDADASLVHVVTGRQGGPYADVNLRWMTLDQLAAFWDKERLFPGPDALNPSMSKQPERLIGCYTLQVGDAIPLCVAGDFIAAARAQAEKLLDQESERLDALVTEA